jgi:hypothetical protein
MQEPRCACLSETSFKAFSTIFTGNPNAKTTPASAPLLRVNNKHLADLHPRVYSKIQKLPPSITYTKSSKGQTTARRNEALREMINANYNTVLIVISSAEIIKKNTWRKWAAAAAE